MNVTIHPSALSGTVAAPSSKSMAHRLLICAALAEGTSVIHNVDFSDDIQSTLDCLSAMNVSLSISGKTVTVFGGGMDALFPKAVLPCRESGSTLRFLIPICLFGGFSATLSGTPKLLSRPLGVYEALCAAEGLSFVRERTCLHLSGRLKGNYFKLPADVSSQFITGMLLALGGCRGGELSLTGAIESRPYIDMTLAAMRSFGVDARWSDERTLIVPSDAHYTATEMVVEGDYSGAAFLEALNIPDGAVRVTGLNKDSLQGDRIYQSLLPQMTRGFINVSLANCPDLAPILMAVAAVCHGAIFTDTARLRFKESNRGEAMAEELRKFGASVVVTENSVTVEKSKLHAPTDRLSAHNDHRVAMALSVLMTRYGGTLTGAESVRKSFPNFYEKLKSLGADIT